MLLKAKYIDKIKAEKPNLSINEEHVTIKKDTFNMIPIEKLKLISPFLKWVGGKTQIISDVMKQFPKEIDGYYYEPFVGGGSVFLEFIKRLECGNYKDTKNKIKGKIKINDFNGTLIDLYIMIKENPKKLIKSLKSFKDSYNKAEMPKPEYKIDEDGNNLLDNKGEPVKKRVDTKKMLNQTLTTAITKGKDWVYYHYREDFNKESGFKYNKPALLLFLNKTCWRGVHREGKNGFNVPFGNYNTPSIYNEEQLYLLSKLFTKYNVEFSKLDFVDFCGKKRGKTNKTKLCGKVMGKNNFIYFDPPYYPLKPDKSFTSYNSNGYGLEQHKQLVEICKELKTQKTHFLQSNSFCDWNVEQYNDFTQTKILCKRIINSKNPKDTDYELFISY